MASYFTSVAQEMFFLWFFFGFDLYGNSYEATLRTGKTDLQKLTLEIFSLNLWDNLGEQIGIKNHYI